MTVVKHQMETLLRRCHRNVISILFQLLSNIASMPVAWTSVFNFFLLLFMFLQAVALLLQRLLFATRIRMYTNTWHKKDPMLID
mmetsp:Transcript_50402/g.92593  ORF Transcript_50402/g.92593 Transcript_50402/m.92593 type:complete len:84 (+) Transcript_50402:340-591(+)